MLPYCCAVHDVMAAKACLLNFACMKPDETRLAHRLAIGIQVKLRAHEARQAATDTALGPQAVGRVKKQIWMRKQSSTCCVVQLSVHSKRLRLIAQLRC